MEYPDKWVIVKIKGDDPHYKIFGSWYGGYLDGDRWKMNSGITGVEMEGDFYVVKGASGSIYKCHKESYGAHCYGAGVLEHYVEKSGGLIEPMPEMPDMLNMDWILK